jgi:hypothetical protein
MKVEPNEFGPDIFVKTEGDPAVKASRKAAPRRKTELFARITERHCVLLADVESPSSIVVFGLLMIHSVKMFHRPFEMPVEYLTEKTGLNRRQQLRAVRDLDRVGILRDVRAKRYASPLIVIPGTSKTGRQPT